LPLLEWFLALLEPLWWESPLLILY